MAYISKWKGTEIDDSIQKVVDNSETWDSKQEKLKGKQGQVVGFDALGNAVAQDLGDGDAVTSFNGRKGDVLPQTGDYTASMVGAKPAEWMPTPADIGALPDDVNIPTKTSELENDSGFITASDIGDIDIGDLENVVHVDGGATLEIPVSIGNAPHVITVTEESGDGGGGGGGTAENGVPAGGLEGQILAKASNADYDTEWIDAPTGGGATSASDISYDGIESGSVSTNVQDAIDELFISVSEGKSLIASAVTDKGVETAADASFETIAENISQISSVPSGVSKITLSAYPTSGGIVIGGGYASDNMTIEINAEPNSGYNFNSWKENNNIVSDLSTYKFIVNGEKSLTAFFDKSLSWNSVTVPSGPWVSATYGSGKFVITPGYDGSSPGTYSNKSIYSTNGTTWNTSTLPIASTWNSVIYGGSKFIATGPTGKGAYSSNGTSWSEMTIPTTSINNNFMCYVYGGGKYLAFPYGTSSGSEYYYSTDGISWTKGTYQYNFPVNGIAYGANKYVAVASTYGGDNIMYSSNGTSWETLDTGANSNLDKIIYAENKFTAIGKNVVAYSTDGINWTKSSGNKTFSTTCISIAYGDGIYIALFGENNAGVSRDGINWEKFALPKVDGIGVSVAFGGHKFVLISRNNSYNSTDTIYYASTQ